MPTESELRDALRAAPDAAARTGAEPLDAASVIRKARAHRRPKQFVLGSATLLAVVGIGYTGVTAIPWPQSVLMSASDSGAAPETAIDDFTAGGSHPMAPDPSRESAALSNRCGTPLIETGPSASGLVLTTDFPEEGPANGLPVEGTVTLTNTGTQRVTGTTDAQPTIVISHNGVTVWHSNGAVRSIGILVDLAPGESMDYPTSLTPVECTMEDESGLSFPSDLPPLSTGVYQVSARIDLALDASDAPAELVGGPSQDITLTGG
ncbi:hypothetical protein GCM10022239_15330 [Leifsonia bigeumensis]|uniref:Uncharacterized protein n=1 Tax=Leifsonella bigeumensis TaxID=433643 RepID=A0ABP7FLL6_9MICO